MPNLDTNLSNQAAGQGQGTFVPDTQMNRACTQASFQTGNVSLPCSRRVHRDVIVTVASQQQLLILWCSAARYRSLERFPGVWALGENNFYEFTHSDRLGQPDVLGSAPAWQLNISPVRDVLQIHEALSD